MMKGRAEFWGGIFGSTNGPAAKEEYVMPFNADTRSQIVKEFQRVYGQ